MSETFVSWSDGLLSCEPFNEIILRLPGDSSA